MKPKSYTFKVKKTGQALLDFLTEELNQAIGVNISKSRVRTLIFAGAAYIDSKRTQKPHQSLVAGSHVMAYVDLPKLQNNKASRDKKIELTSANFIYEDQDIVVVNKPAGVPTQATVDNVRDHLYAAVQRYLKERENKEVYVGLHHRLDYDTSGLILFTKRKSANFWVSELFKNREIRKTYHAVVSLHGKHPPGDRWEVKNHIARAKNKNKGRAIHMEEVRSGGDLAHTSFCVLKNLNTQLQLVECSPHTGRTHQIRVHLQKSGLPILGDVLYGGTPSKRIYLHAKLLEFKHGGTQKNLKVDAPYPDDFVSVLDSSLGNLSV